MSRAGWAVTALVLFTLLRGAIWALVIPPLDAPDEPSHLITVAQIQATGRLPVAFLLDPNTLRPDSTPRPQPILDYLAANPGHFTRFRALSYESTQPPLYHLLVAVLTLPWAGDPQSLLYAGRLVSVLLGGLTVWATARAAATLAPAGSAFALGVPLALTLLPQFAFQTATLTNDMGLNLAAAGLAWAWAAALRAPADRRWPLLLGLLTALGLLTKLTLLATLPVTARALLGRANLSPRPSPRGGGESHSPSRGGGWGERAVRLLTEGALVAAPMALLVGPWVVRNLRVYGEPTGAAMMFGVIHKIYTDRLRLPATTRIIIPDVQEFVVITFQSAWGVFGWRAAYLAPELYWLALTLTLAGAAGAVLWVARKWRARAPVSPALAWTLAAYSLLIVTAIGSYLSYTISTDGSIQGRYTFLALVPFACIGVGGVCYGLPPSRARRLLAGAALAGMVVIQIAGWIRIGQP